MRSGFHFLNINALISCRLVGALICCWMMTDLNRQVYAQSTLSPDATQGLAYYNRADELFRENPDSSVIYTNLAMPLLKKSGLWEEYVNCYNAHCAMNYLRGEFEEYQYNAHEALRNAEVHLDRENVAYSSALNNLALIYRLKGNYPESIKIMQQALEIPHNDAPKSQMALAKIYTNIGQLYRRNQDYAESIRYLNYAATIKRSTPGIGPVSVATSLHSIGRVYQSMESPDSAQVYFRLALQTLDGLSPEKYQKIFIELYHRLAEIHSEGNRFDSAMHLLNLALELQVGEKVMKKDQTYRVMARVRLNQGKWEQAKTALTQALAYWQQKTPQLEIDPGLSSLYGDMGNLYLQKGDHQQALEWYQKGIYSLVATQPGPDDYQLPAAEDFQEPHYAVALLIGKGKTMTEFFTRSQDTQDLIGALRTYQLLMDLMPRLRNSFSADGSKLFLAAQMGPVLESAIGIAYELYKITGNPAYSQAAFQFAELNKTTLLYESMRAAESKYAMGLPDSTLQLEKTLQLDIGFYQKKAFQETQKGEATDHEKLTRWQNLIFETEQKQRKLQDQIRKQYPEYFLLKYDNQAVTLLEARIALPDHRSAFVEYFWGEEMLYTFAISKIGVKMYQQPHSPALQQAIRRSIHYFQNRNYSSDSLLTYLNATQQVSDILFPFIDDFGSGLNHLIIIPDGMLGFLSFEAMPEPAALRTGRTSGTNKVMLHQYHIRYAYSVRLLCKAPTLPDNSPPEQAQVGAFAPAYSAKLALSNNQSEVMAVCQQISGKSWMDSLATEAAFKAHAEQYDIIHLAMHGYPELNDPAFSRLLFSEAPGSDQDGNLHAYEIYNMRLQARLAVLSACETGYGKWEKGEGIMSLARAFRHAGCSGVVMSLWKTDGLSTQKIIQHFYRGLKKGLKTDEALRYAKLQFIENSPPETKAPYYWAHLVLIGENQPLFPGSMRPLLLVGMALSVLLIGYGVRHQKSRTS